MTNRTPTDDAPRVRTASSAPSLYGSLAHKPWLLAMILVIVTVVAYTPAMRAGFIWDDDYVVTNNPVVRSLGGLERIWFQPGSTLQYYPLVFTSFWAEYHLWNLRPFGYHLVNILLHASNAVLLWLVLRRLKTPGSWWAAAVLALHPVCVESVAWITERKNVLSGLFYFLTVLAYLRFRPLNDPDGTCVCNWRYYPLVLALFVCALLSKTVTCSLPAAFLLLVWWKTGRVEKRDIAALLPLFALGVAAGLMTAWMEKHVVGANGELWTLSFVQRCLLAGRALWFYAGKLFWPHPLIFIYPHWEIDSKAWWQYLYPAAALALLAALWSLRSRIGRGPLVAALYFTTALAPALGFFDVYPFRYSFVADHFQYLASAGLIALAGCTGTVVCGCAPPWAEPFGPAAAAITLIVLGALTWKQAHIYRDAQTVWQDTIVKNPSCWMAHNDLGALLANKGESKEAIWHFEQAVRFCPSCAEPHNSLGLILAGQGKLDEAIAHYEQALRLNPDYAKAHNNLGNALLQTGRVQEAIVQFVQALRIKPDYAEAHNNLGIALVRLGRMQEAIEQYEQALRIQPDYAEAHNNLGAALMTQGRLPEAIRHYERSLQVNPQNAEAQYNLGVALVQVGRVPEAIEHWEHALRIKPENVDAHYNLAVALEQAGRAQEAIQHYQQALRIQPDFVQARNALARLRGVE
jgi:tetratricopeptide (TPR) repeat protein